MCNLPDTKAIIRNLVELVGGPEAAAKICNDAQQKAGKESRVSQAEISYWCNDNKDREVPMDHFLQIDAEAGFMGTAEIAYRCGITRPTNAKPNRTLSTTKAVAELSRAAGELAYTALDAAEDGQLTPAEKRRIRDRAAPLKNIIHALEEVIA